MFTEHINKPSAQVIKTYLRLKDKKSYPVMLKLPVVAGELKNLIIKKTKIPSDDLIIMCMGKQIDLKNESNILHLKDKSILHIINKKYLRNDILELQIRLVLRNQEKSCLGEVKLIAKADQLILEFVEDKLLPVIEERTGQLLNPDCVNLVSNGTVLNKNHKFNHYLIQNGAEIICMINFIEELQRSVKNLSTHKLIGSHRQMKLYQSLTFQPGEKKDTRTSLEELKVGPQQQLEPKKKQSKKTQKQAKKTRYERKSKKPHTEHKPKFSPTLFPEFSDLLNKDITDGYSEEEVPESPVTIEYPKIQRKSQTNVQWYDQKQEQKQLMPPQSFQLEEIQKPEEKTGKQQQPKVQKKEQKGKQKEKQEKIEFYQERTEICKILLGDFLTTDPTKSVSLTRTSRNEFFEEMNGQVQSFLTKKYQKTEVSEIQLEFPKLQKKIPVKPGDFIICRDKLMSSSKLIRQNLLEKFNKLIQQKPTKKVQQDFDLEQRLKREKVQQEMSKTTQISS